MTPKSEEIEAEIQTVEADTADDNDAPNWKFDKKHMVPAALAKQSWPYRFQKNSKLENEEEMSFSYSAHYSAASVDGILIKVGQCVKVEADPGKEPWIGRALEIFMCKSGKGYFRIQWFFRSYDTIIEQLGNEMINKKQIWWSQLMNTNELHTIIGLADVVRIPHPLACTPLSDESIPECEFFYFQAYSFEHMSFFSIPPNDPSAPYPEEENLIVGKLPHTYRELFLAKEKQEEKQKLIPCSPDGDGSDGLISIAVPKQQKYLSLLDLYSGCGAMSTGLEMGGPLAGVTIETRWAVDFNEAACRSLKQNHTNTEVRHEKAEDFLQVCKEWKKLCDDFKGGRKLGSSFGKQGTAKLRRHKEFVESEEKEAEGKVEEEADGEEEEEDDEENIEGEGEKNKEKEEMEVEVVRGESMEELGLQTVSKIEVLSDDEVVEISEEEKIKLKALFEQKEKNGNKRTRRGQAVVEKPVRKYAKREPKRNQGSHDPEKLQKSTPSKRTPKRGVKSEESKPKETVPKKSNLKETKAREEKPEVKEAKTKAKESKPKAKESKPAKEESDVEVDEGEYEVESIQDIRWVSSSSYTGLQFKIRWKGYSKNDDTWEPESFLTQCDDALKKFVEEGMAKKILPLPGDVGIVCGGPPCQGASGHNRFRNYTDPLKDEKNRQLIVFMDIVEYLCPEFVLMENVSDLMKLKNGLLAQYAVARLVELHYQSRTGLLVAGSFGVAQFRMRAFFFGAKHGQNLPRFPLPTHLCAFMKNNVPVKWVRSLVAWEETSGLHHVLEKGLVLEDCISDFPPVTNKPKTEEVEYSRDPQTVFEIQMRLPKTAFKTSMTVDKNTLNSVLYDHRPLELNDDDYFRTTCIPKKKGACFRDLPGVKSMPDKTCYLDPELQPRPTVPSGKPLCPDYAISFRFGKSFKPFARLWWDDTVPTVVTRAEPHNQQILHPEQDRVLTIRENARLQGFPDHYKLFGQIKERYCQVGNAVSVPTAQALGFVIGVAAMGHQATTEPLIQLPKGFPFHSFEDLPL